MKIIKNKVKAQLLHGKKWMLWWMELEIILQKVKVQILIPPIN